MKKQEVKQTRRAFLRGALITGGAAAAAIAAGDSLAAPQAPAVKDAQPQSAESKGYHVTDHIRDYYKTARS